MTRAERYMTARQASAAMGVSLPTLYAYVSRGMVRSEPSGGRSRVRRYVREDVERLIERRALRRDPARAAAAGLHWGAPVLESSLTLIDGGRLFYRGHDAIALAEQATLEETAALLWTGDSSRAHDLFRANRGPAPPAPFPSPRQSLRLGVVERLQLALPLAAAADRSAYDLRPAAVAGTGATILRVLFATVHPTVSTGFLDATLAAAWLPRRSAAGPALRAALVLCADHELNVSAFTARCIASARATPYEVVLGALAALRGRRHGGASEEVADVFREAERTRRTQDVLARRLRSAGALPGFGHPAYPNGDPRARLLLALAETYGKDSAVELTQRLVRAAGALTGEGPNLDFGLVALARGLGLPAEAPITLFALGRTVGWIAHAIEQYADDRLIRPRARYVGRAPNV